MSAVHDSALYHPVSVRRPELVEDVRRSCQIGEVRGNGEYGLANEPQGQMERRISELRYFLGAARLLEGSEANARQATLGPVAAPQDAESEEEWEVALVTSLASPEQDYLSIQCPLSEAASGKAPGALRYGILSVRPLSCPS
jgi:transcription elongation GreA/GreB family factor